MSGWGSTEAGTWNSTANNTAEWGGASTNDAFWKDEAKPIAVNGDAHFSDAKDHDFNGEADKGDDKCRNCNQPGHFARECPEERKLTGECFNCGQVGHNKVDCPNPKVERPFTGTCRICEVEGHRAAECPQKPADICRNCLKEGHKAAECDANMVFDKSKIPDMDKGAAWKLLEGAAREKEIVEFREALKIYTKADSDITYPQLEAKLRDSGLGIYLIALDKEIPQSMTNVNLQGKRECKYTVGFYFKPKPTRPVLQQYWPDTPEENMERLGDAGETMENTVPLCRRCNELGHTSKECKLDRVEPIDAVGIVCVNCSETTHRLRDCPKERAPRGGTCRNCNQPGHKAADCTEERSAANVECRRCNEQGHFAKDCPNKEAGGGGGGCRNCGEEGHFAKDCDKPKNPANMICRNCDQAGHSARECPEPKDWSKVKCNNCGEMGHTVKRCKQPVPEDDNKVDTEDAPYESNSGNADMSDNWATTQGPTAAWEAPAASNGW